LGIQAYNTMKLSIVVFKQFVNCVLICLAPEIVLIKLTICCLFFFFGEQKFVILDRKTPVIV